MEIDKLYQLCKYIYDSSVISYNGKNNPAKHIQNIKEMVRTYIRTEVTPCELTDDEKLIYIVENEGKMLTNNLNGHRCNDSDEFQETRNKIKIYRKELGLL
jgi:hypothetical protein